MVRGCRKQADEEGKKKGRGGRVGHSGRQQTVWKRAKFLIKNATKQKQRTKTDCCPLRVCVYVSVWVIALCVLASQHVCVCVFVLVFEIQKRFRAGNSNSKTWWKSILITKSMRVIALHLTQVGSQHGQHFDVSIEPDTDPDPDT